MIKDSEPAVSPESIIDFWYSDRIKPQWFNSTPELDDEIRDRFELLWHNASQGEYNYWCETAEGCLALIIILDQFPLNMFRGKPESFKTESQAVKFARLAVEKKHDKVLSKDNLAFLYMPLMHSENPDDQDLSVSLFEQAGLTENARFANHHRDIVRRFGRFPHRNAILQRISSQEELDYLNSKEAFKG